MRPVRGRTVIISTAVVLLIGATSMMAAGETPLRVVVPLGIDGLDPHAESRAVGLGIHGNIFEPLLVAGSDGRPEQVLATKVTKVSDRVWRFELRQGVRFHNGAPFDSADVVASVLRARDNPRSISRVVLHGVTQVAAEGPNAVRLDLSKGDPIFLERLSEIRMVPRDSPAEIVNPVGTGPYRFVSYERDSSMVLEAFAGYWGKAPHEKRVEITFDADGTAGITRLLANRTDLVTQLRPSQVAEVEAHDDLWIDSALGNNVLFLVLNCDQPPFNSSIVREAFDCAIDRQAIAQDVFLNYARPASQLVSSTARGYAPGLEPAARNVAKARALVAAVAGDAGISFTLQAGDSREAVARLIQSQLAEVGLHAQVLLKRGPEVLVNIRDGKIQAGMMAYRSPISDVGSTFGYMVHSQSPGSYKTGMSTPEIDRLIDASQDALDPEARLSLLHSIAARLAERRGFLPIVWTMDLYGARRELQWQPSAGWGMPLATALRRPQ
jgi:peptide/nickel transport system substrate-binding protein